MTVRSSSFSGDGSTSFADGDTSIRLATGSMVADTTLAGPVSGAGITCVGAHDAAFVALSETCGTIEATGSLRWAKVDADATGAALLSGSGVTSASRIGVGVFSVTFDSSVVDCGWTATLNDNSSGLSEPGEISVELADIGAAQPTVWVRTHDSAGEAVDPADSDGFTLMASCP